MRTSSIYKTQISQTLRKHDHAEAAVAAETAGLAKAGRRAAGAAEAVLIAQSIAQAVQEHAHARIASVVTRCLTTIFDDAYSFNITFERKRSKTEARLEILEGGHTLEDPCDEAAGGCLDIASFALRLAALVLTQPPRRRLLILDEPFKNVSTDRRPAVRTLLATLADELGVQFVVVTHLEDLVFGKVVEL